jgi:hypothetical protein
MSLTSSLLSSCAVVAAATATKANDGVTKKEEEKGSYI